MTDNEIIAAFHAMWDDFPEGVTITQKNREIVAVNKVAERFGAKAGDKCSSYGRPEDHRGCRLNEAVDEEKTVAITYEGPCGKAYGFWIPISERPGWVLHFSVGLTYGYEKA